MNRSRVVIHLVLCLLTIPLAVWVTWPLATHLDTHIVDVEALHGEFYLLSLADQYLAIWIHAWDAHALATHPSDLFDAGIFHPAPWSLARSEHFLGNALLFAPVYLATSNAVLAHNLALLACMVLSAWAVYFVVWKWVRRFEVAFVSGALFAFAPWRLLEGNIQVQFTAYLPLIVWFGFRVMRGGGLGARLALFAVLTLQGLCSVYLAVQAFLAFAVVVGVGSIDSPRTALAGLRRSSLPALGAVAILALLHIPYALLKHLGEIPVSSLRMQELVSASPIANYVRFRDFEGGRYFLSAAAFVLAAAGAGSGRWLRRQRPEWWSCYLALLVLGLVAYLLSLGPTLQIAGFAVPMPYRLAAALPGIGSLRGAFRFGILVTLAASGLAAIGMVRLAAGGGSIRRLSVSGISMLALLLEVGAHSYPVRPMLADPSEIDPYRWLATVESGPVLELPVGDVEKDFRANLWEARYTYFGQVHWLPLLNGYSSYPPESYRLVMAIARRLPDPRALGDLVKLTGLRWIVVHGAALDAWDRSAWAQEEPTRGLRRRAHFADVSVFEVTPGADAAPGSWTATSWTARKAGSTHTLSGADRAPLAPDEMQARLGALELGAPLVAKLSTSARVRIENRGPRVWPGLGVAREGLVALRDEWIPVGSKEVVQSGSSRLATDLAPGAELTLPFTMVLPRRPGTYRLRLGLVQEGVANFPPSEGGSLEVVVPVVPWPADAD